MLYVNHLAIEPGCLSRKFNITSANLVQLGASEWIPKKEGQLRTLMGETALQDLGGKKQEQMRLKRE